MPVRRETDAMTTIRRVPDEDAFVLVFAGEIAGAGEVQVGRTGGALIIR